MKFKKGQRVVARYKFWDGGGLGLVVGTEISYIVKMDSGPTFKLKESEMRSEVPVKG